MKFNMVNEVEEDKLRWSACNTQCRRREKGIC
jgi:hypothetical protein